MLYLSLALLGFVLPYYFLVSFLMANGLDLRLFIAQLFANDISTFFVVDLIVTAIVFLIYSFRETRRLGMKRWWVYVVATLGIGPSFSVPLFLHIRESHLSSEAM